MIKRRVVLSRLALADLRAITIWLTAEASGDVARRYIRRIREHLQRLAFASERGTVRHDVAAGLRVIGLFGNVSVAFRVKDDRVDIVRILHGGQDWKSDLAADDVD